MKLQFFPNSDKQFLASLAWQNDSVDDVIYGGAAGGGKSYWECAMMTLDAMRWPDTRYFIGRNELINLMRTTYVTLTHEVFKHMGLKRGYHWKFNGQDHTVYLRQHGRYVDDKGKAHEPAPWSTITLLDLKFDPSDPDFDRFGSHLYTRGAIEEMSEVSFRAYDILRSRIGRYRNKELSIKGKLAGSLNPSEEWPYRIFYDPWSKAGRPTDPNKPLVSMRAELDGEMVERTFVFIPANAKENPDLPREYRINLATLQDPVLKARLADGDWEFSNAVDVLFSAKGLANLFNTVVKWSEDKYMTVDVARLGADKIVLMFWQGWKCYKIKWYEKKRTTETSEIIRNELIAEEIPREHCLIDQDGVGGGVVDQVDGCIGFSGGAAPFGRVGEMQTKEQYENLRAQCVYFASTMVEDRKVAVTEQDVQVREWLSTELPKFKRFEQGKSEKKRVTPKSDIKSALGHSPDFGDAFWMRAYFDVREREPKLAKKQLGTLTVQNQSGEDDSLPVKAQRRKKAVDTLSVNIQG